MTRHLGLTFTDELAQAVADGRKTQTRRPMKPQPPRDFCYPGAFALHNADRSQWAIGITGACWPPGDEPGIKPRLPGSGIARVGDLLWVRECWATGRILDAVSPSGIARMALEAGWSHPWAPIWYRVGGWNNAIDYDAIVRDWDGVGKWRPSIHMPKWACRTWARITAVYPERVADISEADAVAEGFDSRDAFLAAYRDIYGSTGGWCWVVKFERCDAPDLSGGDQ